MFGRKKPPAPKSLITSELLKRIEAGVLQSLETIEASKILDEEDKEAQRQLARRIVFDKSTEMLKQWSEAA